jgi:long-chain acyl-CoA synthetase
LEAGQALEIMRGFEQTFGCMILEAYGLSETSPIASFNHPDRVRKPGSIGTPMQGVEMRIVDGEGASLPVGDVGEIAIRGHNVMKGYWGKPEATATAIPDGWFRTGDLAQADADGYFHIVGRAKDLIIRGGYNVYPREIRGRPARAPGGGRGGRDRHPACRARRGSRRCRGAQARSDSHSGRTARVHQGTGGGI